jgi:hypothetical protein
MICMKCFSVNLDIRNLMWHFLINLYMYVIMRTRNQIEDHLGGLDPRLGNTVLEGYTPSRLAERYRCEHVFGRCCVYISIWTPGIKKVFYFVWFSVPLCKHRDSTAMRPAQLLSKSSLIHYSVFLQSEAIQSEILTAFLNGSQKKAINSRTQHKHAIIRKV